MFLLNAVVYAVLVSSAYTPYHFVGFDHEVWPNKPADLSTPLGIRLGLGSETSMNVGWSTFEKPGNACVSYGTNESVNKTICANGSTTYETSRLWFSHVELTDLAPGTKYYYKVHSSNSSVPIYSFVSGLKVGDKSPFSFAIAADMGLHGPDGYEIQMPQQYGNETHLMDPNDYHISAERLSIMADHDNIHLVVHPGDFAYADDATSNYNDVAHGGVKVYEALLEQFYTQLQQISRKVAYMVGPGNHEAACKEVKNTEKVCPVGQNNFTDFRYRFDGLMPTGFESTSKNETAQELRQKAISLAVPPMWYSFDYGSVHYVMINTETDFKDAPDQTGSLGSYAYGLTEGPFGFPHQQQEWLAADLASVDRKVTPWVLVYGHRPWYTSEREESGCLKCQDAFEDILYKYSTDMFIAGHVHNSQRYAPLYQGVPDPRGYTNPLAPTYLVAGGAGNIEGLYSVSEKETEHPGLQWSNSEFYTVVRIDVQSETELNVNFVRSSDGEVIDTFTLHREHKEAFPRNSLYRS